MDCLFQRAANQMITSDYFKSVFDAWRMLAAAARAECQEIESEIICVRDDMDTNMVICR